MNYLFIFATIVGMVSGQLLIKKGITVIAHIPSQLNEFLPFFIRAFTNIWVITGILCVLIASLFWLVAQSKSQLSHIYPFLGLNFVLVPLLSILIFKDTMPLIGWIGIICICVGVVLVGQS